MKLIRINGAYYLRGVMVDDNGEHRETDAWLISDGPHYIEIRVSRASSATAQDATYETWIDGISKTTMTGVDNYEKFFDFKIVSAGLNGISGAVSGTYFMDEIVINVDGSEIGPVNGVSLTQTPTLINTMTSTPTPIFTPTFTPTKTLPPSSTPTNTPSPFNSTGFLSPSTNAAVTSNAGDNNGYETNPFNAYTNNTAVAIDLNSGTNTSTSCTNNGKDKQYFSYYNFNIPATAAIKGIEIRLDARTDSTIGSPKICVAISWNGGISWTTSKSTTTLSTTETSYLLGGSTDTWSRTWTPANFGNTSFGVRIVDVAGSTLRDFYLDYIAINVTYQP
jgi:hypothetical protein